jgi:hypothetical protein
VTDLSANPARAPLARGEFVEWLRREGTNRYHDHHRYHVLMHEGKLTKLQLQQWVLHGLIEAARREAVAPVPVALEYRTRRAGART